MKGLAFLDDTINSEYYEIVKGEPELFCYLYLFIDNNLMIDDFIDKSPFYQFEYLVPIDEVYFENYEELSYQDKQHHIIVKSL